MRLAPGVDPAHPVVALVRRITELFDARDWSRYREPYDARFVAIDRRRVGWGHELDLDWLLQTNVRAVEMYPDLRQRSEVLAVRDHMVARVGRLVGDTTEGGGAGENRFGVLAVCEHGRIVRDEFFDAEDRAPMLARLEDLQVARRNLAVRAHERGAHAPDAMS